MHGLRVKLALIFVGSVLAVVLVATAVTALMLSIGDTDRLMGPMARHMAIANDIIAAGPDGSARELRQPPDSRGSSRRSSRHSDQTGWSRRCPRAWRDLSSQQRCNEPSHARERWGRSR